MILKRNYLINGDSESILSPLDRGFSYGDGVFRTLKVVNGELKHWHLHYQKLNDNCSALGIECPSPETLLSDIRHLISENDSAVIKIVITRGNGERGYSLPVSAKPNRVVIKSQLPTYPEVNLTDGVKLRLCKTKLSSQPLLAGIKHLNRLENVLARAEWSDNTYADGLMLDMFDNAIECTMSNLFIRKGDKLLTPDLSQCGVAGITRQRIIDLAESIGLQIEICRVPLALLISSDEVIICNSVFGVWQVTSLDQIAISTGQLALTLRQQLMD